MKKWKMRKYTSDVWWVAGSWPHTGKIGRSTDCYYRHIFRRPLANISRWRVLSISDRSKRWFEYFFVGKIFDILQSSCVQWQLREAFFFCWVCVWGKGKVLATFIAILWGAGLTMEMINNTGRWTMEKQSSNIADFWWFINNEHICQPVATMWNKVGNNEIKRPFAEVMNAPNGKMTSSKLQSWQTWKVGWIFGSTPKYHSPITDEIFCRKGFLNEINTLLINIFSLTLEIFFAALSSRQCVCVC